MSAKLYLENFSTAYLICNLQEILRRVLMKDFYVIDLSVKSGTSEVKGLMLGMVKRLLAESGLSGVT